MHVNTCMCVHALVYKHLKACRCICMRAYMCAPMKVKSCVRGVSLLSFQIADEECQQVFNMTVTEERFEFLSSSDWENHGDYNLFKRVNNDRLSLGLCYYKIGKRAECVYHAKIQRGWVGVQVPEKSQSYRPCEDPESFVRGGKTLTTLF